MARKIKLDNSVIKRQKRKEAKLNADETSKPILCRILIVCEGEKTEPNYFNAFKKLNSRIDITCEGIGQNTLNVVNRAIELRDNAQTPYDRVWAVFDKDDFSANNFNAAIQKAQSNNINVAWSNEAFELWYLYHFQHRVTPMSRDDYAQAITAAVNGSEKWSCPQKAYKYKKNDDNNYYIMTKYGNLHKAIQRAENQYNTFTTSQTTYAQRNPCTTVHLLVKQLINEDQDLITEVMKKINEN